jgi:formylglycine-generating enzyme required for sulfatase activity
MKFLRNLSGNKQPVEPGAGTRLTDPKGVAMVYVPAGKFLMGSNDNDDEKPRHEVAIVQGFWLDLTPVTNEMYGRFVKEGGYESHEFWTDAGWRWVQKEKKAGPTDYNEFTDPQQPRVGVSWYGAYAYCRWRGGRLPTEAEWEWAARGPENRIYPWGNTFDVNRVVCEQNSGDKTALVGTNIRIAGAS